LEEKNSTKNQVVLSYKELNVYKLAFDSAMRIYLLSKKWPAEERYSLTDQARRSSRSVCGNIAEAWRKRRYPAHFVSKLSDADMEAAETENWIEFAFHCHYLHKENYDQLNDNYDHICRMLTIMMTNSESWCLHQKIKNSSPKERFKPFACRFTIKEPGIAKAQQKNINDLLYQTQNVLFSFVLRLASCV